jgi:hypothetical protein
VPQVNTKHCTTETIAYNLGNQSHNGKNADCALNIAASKKGLVVLKQGSWLPPT